MRFKVLPVVILLYGLTWSTSSTHAQEHHPSFDCAHATKAVENVICEDGDLSFLDRALDQAYQRLRDHLDAAARKDLLVTQRAWLHQLPPTCPYPGDGIGTDQKYVDERACLAGQYRQRLTTLVTDLKAKLVPAEMVGAPEPLPAAEVDIEDRSSAVGDPRLILARIQSNLEHIAVGRPTWPKGKDPLEEIADAYKAFQAGDIAAMDATRGALWSEISNRRGQMKGTRYTDYFDALDRYRNNPFALVRLIIMFREIDAILLIETGDTAIDDLTKRSFESGFVYFSTPTIAGTWLKLPCRTILGHQTEFEGAEKELGKLTGDLLSCPSDTAALADLSLMAENPWLFPSIPAFPDSSRPGTLEGDHFIDQPQRKPWDHETAVAEMGDYPDIAGPILLRDANLNAPNKMDYILFLDSFQPKSDKRDAIIAKLLDEIVVSTDSAEGDGTVENVLTVASTGEQLGGYIIPCAVLLAHPEFVEAMGSYWGGNGDSWRPQSGCDHGRGRAKGFPSDEFRTYLNLSTQADDNYLGRIQGSQVASIAADQRALIARVQVNPRFFLNGEVPSHEYPYQAWGMLSLKNYSISLHVKAVYDDLLPKVIGYYQQHGLSATDAARAAKRALFVSVWNADEGAVPAPDSLPALILRHAPIEDISRSLKKQATAYPGTSPTESYPQLAVDYPEALSLLLAKGYNANNFDSDSKTTLMIAAERNQIDSIKLLLLYKPQLNRVTWTYYGQDDNSAPLHDAQTALMFAAANASLPLIKALLAAGADPYQSDTKGRRAVDYLLGYGGEAANTKLTLDERIEAIRLLY